MDKIEVKIVNRGPHELPQYGTALSAGMDLRAWLDEPLTLQPLQRALVHTGIYIALPEGYECQIRPRSGLALKRGLTVLNTPGTIDADYRGEVGVIVVNVSNEPQIIVWPNLLPKSLAPLDAFVSISSGLWYSHLRGLSFCHGLSIGLAFEASNLG